MEEEEKSGGRETRRREKEERGGGAGVEERRTASASYATPCARSSRSKLKHESTQAHEEGASAVCSQQAALQIALAISLAAEHAWRHMAAWHGLTMHGI